MTPIRHAFTLLEVILVTAISAIIFMALTWAMYTGASLRTHLNQKGMQLDDGNRIVQEIAIELRTADQAFIYRSISGDKLWSFRVCTALDNQGMPVWGSGRIVTLKADGRLLTERTSFSSFDAVTQTYVVTPPADGGEVVTLTREAQSFDISDVTSQSAAGSSALNGRLVNLSLTMKPVGDQAKGPTYGRSVFLRQTWTSPMFTESIDTGGGTTTTAPEIGLARVGGSAVTDGGTDTLGSAFTVGVPTVVRYNIINSGTNTLTISGSATISNTSGCSITVSRVPPSTIAAGATDYLELTVTPSETTWHADVAVFNNDADENPYNWTMSATSAPSSPVISVSRAGNVVSLGSTDQPADSFKNNRVTTLRYDVANTGSSPLIISQVLLGATYSNCTFAVQKSITTAIPVGSSDYLLIDITPSNPTWYCWVAILNNDPTNGTFTWKISSTGVPPANPVMSVNRQSGPTVANNGTDALGTAFVLGNATVIRYNVGNTTGTGPLMITSGPTLSGVYGCTLTLSRALPSTIAIGASDYFELTLTPSAAAFGGGVSIANNDSNNNPYSWSLSGATPPLPGISVQRQGGATVVCGGTDAAGSSWTTGTAATVRYTVSNPGTAALTLGSVSLGTATGCTVTISRILPTSIAAAANDYFELSLTPNASNWSFAVSFTTNVSGQNPFTWTTSGTATGTTPPPVNPLDNMSVSWGLDEDPAAKKWLIRVTVNRPDTFALTSSNCTVTTTSPSSFTVKRGWVSGDGISPANCAVVSSSNFSGTFTITVTATYASQSKTWSKSY